MSDQRGRYVLVVADTRDTPHDFWLVGPFLNWGAANDWAENTANPNWHLVEVDPRQPIHVVSPDAALANTTAT
jgi:hypothetical protein